jgi:hypothetical protein
MLNIFKPDVRKGIGTGELSKDDRIRTFTEMGDIIAEELDLKLVSFDPTLSFRDDHWNHTQISLDFAILLVKKLIELRVLREVLIEVEKIAFPRPEVPNLIKSMQEKIHGC